MKLPGECTSIEEVREAIDLLDKEIISLLGKRYGYVKTIVRFKEKDKDSIIAHERREQVIRSRRQMAAENGLNPDVIETVYRSLISHFIEEEMEIISRIENRPI